MKRVFISGVGVGTVVPNSRGGRWGLQEAVGRGSQG